MLWEGWGQQRHAAQARWHSGRGGPGCSIHSLTRRAPAARDTEEHRARDHGDRRARDRRVPDRRARDRRVPNRRARDCRARDRPVRDRRARDRRAPAAVLLPPRSRSVRKHSAPAPWTAVSWGVLLCH